MMIEQVDVPAGAAAASVSLGRALSDEARASLEAVRVAQEAARERARRQTVQARIWFAVVLGAVGVAALAVGVHLVRARHARAQAATAAHPAPISPAGTTPAIESPAVPKATETPLRAAEPAARSATELSPGVAQEKPANAANPEPGCDTALIRRAPWRLSASACARAFEADPTNARLALAIAHAEHAHGTPARTAEWAQRALTLDPKAAEAYALIARAERAAGHPEEARAAYRHYLELAPRGWHQAEARAAMRLDAATPRPEPLRVR